MISVCIFINDRLIERVNAVNVSKPGLSPKRIHTYEIVMPKCRPNIKHRRDLGAYPLAIKMLQTRIKK